MHIIWNMYVPLFITPSKYHAPLTKHLLLFLTQAHLIHLLWNLYLCILPEIKYHTLFTKHVCTFNFDTRASTIHLWKCSTFLFYRTNYHTLLMKYYWRTDKFSSKLQLYWMLSLLLRSCEYCHSWQKDDSLATPCGYLLTFRDCSRLIPSVSEHWWVAKVIFWNVWKCS